MVQTKLILKITRGYQRFNEDSGRFYSAVTKIHLYNMAELKEEVEFPVCHLVARGIQHKVAAHYFNSLYTLFNSIMKIVQAGGYLGL